MRTRTCYAVPDQLCVWALQLPVKSVLGPECNTLSVRSRGIASVGDHLHVLPKWATPLRLARRAVTPTTSPRDASSFSAIFSSPRHRPAGRLNGCGARVRPGLVGHCRLFGDY